MQFACRLQCLGNMHQMLTRKQKGKERKGKEKKRREEKKRKGKKKERKGKERKGKERKGKERKGKERKHREEKVLWLRGVSCDSHRFSLPSNPGDCLYISWRPDTSP